MLEEMKEVERQGFDITLRCSPNQGEWFVHIYQTRLGFVVEGASWKAYGDGIEKAWAAARTAWENR